MDCEVIVRPNFDTYIDRRVIQKPKLHTKQHCEYLIGDPVLVVELFQANLIANPETEEDKELLDQNNALDYDCELRCPELKEL